MNRRVLAAEVVLFLFASSTALGAAETGDFDGDGRLTIADVFRRMKKLPPTPGSLERFNEYPDYVRLVGQGFVPTRMEAGFTYHEILRRSVPNALPHWVHFFDAPGAFGALPADPRVSASLKSAIVPGGDADRFDLTIRLSTTVGLRAFSFILENAEEVLRVAINPHDVAWNSIEEGLWLRRGPLLVVVPTSGFLITRGRYVVHSGLVYSGEDSEYGHVILEPGEHEFAVPVRIPKGTPAGKYAVRIFETSQVFLADEIPASPVVGAPAEITIERETTGGWNEGVPPLEIDGDARQVLGRTEYRLANHEGEAPKQGFPIALVEPGANVKVQVQVRTEVPVNYIGYRVEWRSDHIRCAAYGQGEGHAVDGMEVIFRDPDDGGVFPAYVHCEKGWVLPPNHSAAFRVSGKYGSSRPLEYFRPLGAWWTLAEVELHVSGCAEPGEEIHLTFRPFSPGDLNSYRVPRFDPYSPTLEAAGTTTNWIYEAAYEDGYIRVGNGLPRCPEDLPDPGVRFILGKTVGSPGQKVEVPILVSAEGPSDPIRLGLESDPPEIMVDSVWVTTQSRLTGKADRMEVVRGQYVQSLECAATCDFAVPAGLYLVGTKLDAGESVDDRFAAISVGVLPGDGSHRNDPPLVYPGTEIVEIGRLRLTIPKDFTGDEIRLRNATVPIHLLFATLNHESGGVRFGDFYPAKEFREGVIRIIGPGQDFIRGDANLDRAVDVSDAIAVLGYLFLGGSVLACEDTADADDNGEIEITDAIFLLGALFLGNGAIPAPFSDCGPDPELDGLSCEEGNCE